MITNKFQTILILAVLVFLFLVFKMLKHRVTALKYTLLWIFVGVILLLFAVFPSSVQFFANLLGIYADINFLFLLLIALTMMIAFSLTSIVSKQTENTKRLVQELAILKNKVEELEKKSNVDDKKNE